MKKILLFITIILMCCSCGTNDEIENQEDINTYKIITANEAYNMMKNDVYIIDVREENEYNEGHIKDAINISVNSIEEDIESIISNKKSTILVYCRSGARALTAAKILIKLGYENVYDFGGIINWPYEVIK